MAFMDFLFGTPEKTQQFQRFTPQQQQALNSVLQQALAGLQPGAFGKGFEPIAQQARSQFQQQTIPSIAERFTSMGAGAQSSSAFPQILGSAAAGLEGDLASRQAQFGLQQQGLSQNLLGLGLTPQFETAYSPRQPGFAQAGGQALLQILPLLLGGFLGGPGGAMAGGAIGGNLSSLLGNLGGQQ